MDKANSGVFENCNNHIREKLVEQLRWWATECDRTNYGCQASKLLVAAAKYIANGVTIQQWIPVSERLPDDSANVLVCHKNGLVTTNAWLDAHWWFKNEKNPITHWMPLPQPPKGE